jgi:hypothetical protein
MEEEVITFIPHPNTLTATGDQNYRDSDRGKKAFPFAIAEKIVRLYSLPVASNLVTQSFDRITLSRRHATIQKKMAETSTYTFCSTIPTKSSTFAFWTMG